MVLKVPVKSGFKAGSGRVSIYDRNGLFYEHGNGDPFTFNLPPGEFFVAEGDILPLKSPKNYRLPKLDKPIQKGVIPAEIRVFYSKNPHKASIYPNKGIIIFDDSFLDRTTPEQAFIYWHEIGHFLYKDEKSCDKYALKTMLDLGYNPSQVSRACLNTLTQKESIPRASCVHNFAKKA